MIQITPLDTEEPYGGVQPEDFPETYDWLLERRCFKQKENIPLTVDVNDFERTYCGACFQNIATQVRGKIIFNQGLHQNGHQTTSSLSYDRCQGIL